jgi:tetratricopeptide (TPR) repeat protein
MKNTQPKINQLRDNNLKFIEQLQVTSKQIAALLQTGHNLYSHGRLKDARSIFEGLAALDGTIPYVYGILGSIYQKEGNPDQAIAFYTKALSLFPNDIYCLVNRGELYLKAGKFQDAANDFKSAIELDVQLKHPAALRATLLILLTKDALTAAGKNGIEAVLQQN